MATQVTVRSVRGEHFTQEIEAGRHTLVSDEPTSVGGSDKGPGPYEYLLSALGSCISMTLRLYADRKQWPLAGVDVTLSHQRIHARDCEDCDSKDGMLSEIQVGVALEGDLDDAQRTRLMEIAGMCPVHRTLTGEVKIRKHEA